MTGGECRVLITIDAVASYDSVVRAVASVASRPGSDVEVLFVEDETLLRLGGLRVAREVTLEADDRGVAVERLERQLRVIRGRVRSRLEAEAEKAGLHCRFQVARGEPALEVLRAAAGADVLVLPHTRVDPARGLATRLPLGTLVSEGPATVIFVQERWATGTRVVVLYTGEESLEALRSARAIAVREGLGLSVVTPREGGNAHARTSAPEAVDRVRIIEEISPEALLAAMRAEDARVLVLTGAGMNDAPDILRELLSRASCSIITVR
jgi:hypothetical protein